MTPTPALEPPYGGIEAARTIKKAIGMLMVRYTLSASAATELLGQLALDIETDWYGAAQAVIAEAG